jgi:HlyD family secretion protein
MLEAGSEVEKDQVVARMDADELEDMVKEAQETVKAMANAVQASAAKIKASKANQDFAKWNWDTQQKLHAERTASKVTVKEAERDYIQSQVEVEEDQFTYHAMAALASISKLLPIHMNRNLRRAVIKSPIDGVVLARYEKNKRYMTAGEKLLDIGNMKELEVTADILSEEVVEVDPGNEVEIYGPSIGKKPIRGTVARIRPEGFTKISSLGVEQQRVAVIISLNPDDLAALAEQGRALGVQYRVKVRIFTAKSENTLTVPMTALFRGKGGKWELFKVEKGKAKLVDVEVGLTNDREAEITHGLKAGDTVIVAPEASLTSGTRVGEA